MLSAIPKHYPIHQWLKYEGIPRIWGSAKSWGARMEKVSTIALWSINSSMIQSTQKELLSKILQTFDCVIAGGFAVQNVPAGIIESGPGGLPINQPQDDEQGDIDIFIRPAAMNALIFLIFHHFRKHSVQHKYTSRLKQGKAFTEIFFPKYTGLLNMQLIARSDSSLPMQDVVTEFDLSYCCALIQYDHSTRSLVWCCTSACLYSIRHKKTLVLRGTLLQRIQKTKSKGYTVVNWPRNERMFYADKAHVRIEHLFCQYLTDQNYEFQPSGLVSFHNSPRLLIETGFLEEYMKMATLYDTTSGSIQSAYVDYVDGESLLTFSLRRGFIADTGKFRSKASYCLIRSIDISDSRCYCALTYRIEPQTLRGAVINATEKYRGMNVTDIVVPPLLCVEDLSRFDAVSSFKFRVER